MLKKGVVYLSLGGMLVMAGCSTFYIQKFPPPQQEFSRKERFIYKRATAFLRDCYTKGYPVRLFPGCYVEKVHLDKSKRIIEIYFNDTFSYIPFREKNVKLIYSCVKKKLGRRYKKYRLILYSLGEPIEELIPNFYRSSRKEYDYSRIPKSLYSGPPIVRNLSRPYIPEDGLYGKHLVIMPSHGWYYSYERKRWEWQRPRLLQTVEDKISFSLMSQYLIPMLENAGAYVFTPRERDIQTNEVIVDNDSSFYFSRYVEFYGDTLHVWVTGKLPGFCAGNSPYRSGFNPFENGTYRETLSDTIETARVEWIPDIPETGSYAVYVSYFSTDSSVTDARYTVFHTGGSSEFLVNQRMGGHTWIYLGTFRFEKGINPSTGKVILSNKSSAGGLLVTADAVRFGGGMGNIERYGKISRRPRFLEGARYYLQYAGMPDTLLYDVSGDTNDYRDDYVSRAEYANYLKGKPCGPNKDRNVKGLGVPIDLSLSFHTDAGIATKDTVIGTLLIYSIEDYDSAKVFPDGVSRFANRDLADLIQTQIVDDIQKKFYNKWTRRALYNKQYREVYSPNVPSALIELLSHQNFYDMCFLHDPNFKFHACRAIYKAILKFISTEYGYRYVVQPLPVKSLCANFTGERKVTLSWTPVIDPIEETAKPDRYIVYVKRGEEGFDNGVVVDDTAVTFISLVPGKIYSFKVAALNSGGESFPSEVLSVCWQDSSKGNVLIINAFDRVAGPEVVDVDKFKGFVSFLDEGVPYMYDISFVGPQLDFNPLSRFKNNDMPGFGTSFANYETKVIAGNTFDYPYIHGKSIKKLGYSFVSSSDEAVIEGKIELGNFDLVDVILGEEKKTKLPGDKGIVLYEAFPRAFRSVIENYLFQGGKMFISGAYVCTDLFEGDTVDSSGIWFARDVLGMDWGTNFGSRSGRVFVDDSLFATYALEFSFNSEFNTQIYKVEAPDAIIPFKKEASSILRYYDNHFCAGIVYRKNYKVVIFGFPFETIIGQDIRDKVMAAVFRYLE